MTDFFESKKSSSREPEYRGARWENEGATPLELVDRIIAQTHHSDPHLDALLKLRQQIQDDEVTLNEARQMIEKMDEVIKKVTSPANRIATYVGSPKKDIAQIVVGGAEYYCNIDPRMEAKELKVGTRVLVNEAYAVIGNLGYDPNGPVVKVTDVLPDGRLRVGQEHGLQSLVIQKASELSEKNLRAGDEVKVDSNFRVALELISKPESRDHYLDEVPELPWEKVGGQGDAIHSIRDAIELPLVHEGLFHKFKHATPKGFLLYGPPGCGKTLIGKATAFNLTKQLTQKTGKDMKEYFMHIKGPEVLNMWVGESERIVREIFASAREKRKQGFLPFIFIDEAESILGTRRAGRYSSILSTLVPMFCTEMDGIDSLNEVVIILASNRADLIDPAILRPGRIDRKIKVNRPQRDGAKEIFQIYLSPDLPYDSALVKASGGKIAEATKNLTEQVLNALFSHKDENRFLEVVLRSGRKENLYRGDLLSGAIIASVVERAKEIAIKRAIATGKDEGISVDDMMIALNDEYMCNDIFPPNDITEDWLKLIDYDPENVVKVAPIRPNKTEAKRINSGVI